MTKFQLTILGQDIWFNVGLRFLGQYQEKHNCDINGIATRLNNPWKYVPEFMYESMLVASGGKELFTQEELFDFIDDNGGALNEQFSQFLQNFTNSMVGGVPNEPSSKSDSKKK